MLRFLLCSLLLLLAAPAAAPAFTEIAVFRADHATAALPGRSGSALLWPDRGVRRTVSPPAGGCRFTAAGAGRLAWDCGGQLVVTDPHSGDAHRLPAPFSDTAGQEAPATFFIEALGASWIGGFAGAARAQDASFYVNWRTGASHFDSDDTSATAFPDLNAPGLFAPLCAGARRLPNHSYRSGQWGSARAAGHWVLTSNDTFDSIDRRQPRGELHRCGTRDAITIHGVATSALSASWLAWSDNLRGGRIALRHLRDGRVWHRFLLAPRGDEPVVVLTDRYVYSGGFHRRALPRG